METIQPFKKRVVEHPIVYSQPPYDRTANQTELPEIQYIQYIQPNECINAAIRQHTQLQAQGAQVINIEPYEPPMLLNAWTQTKSDDFPPLTKSNDKALLAKIKQLEKTIESQAEKLKELEAKASSPVRAVTQQPNTPPSDTKPIEYRIINQTAGPNDETQFEIEISNDKSQEIKKEITNTSYASDKENQFVQHMYAQITSTPVPNSKTKNTKMAPLQGPFTPTTGIPKKIDPSKGQYISIGLHGTKVPAEEFKNMSWKTPSIAARNLLTMVFDRETLATHSMTGKASPAFKDLNKPVKKHLDERAVQDIVYEVKERFEIKEKEIRTAITTKCADENKMFKAEALKKLEAAKRPALGELNLKKKK